MSKQKPTFTTLADFQSQFNPDVRIPTQIRAGLASLLSEGKESAEFEEEFCKRAGIQRTTVSKYREQFSKHIIQTPRIDNRAAKYVWFADASVAAKARG